MIKIRIKKSKHFKDTSKYSAYVPDNSLYYDTLSQMSSYFYDDINELWEIPENKIQELKDRLSWFEYDIENEELLSIEKYKFKTKAFPHQIEGIEYGMEHDKFHLGDEQGLGKTFQCINIALLRKEKYNYQHCLVICGVATLKWNWKDEIETHSNEKCWIIGCKKNKIGKNKGALKDKGNAEKLEQLKNLPEPYFWVINIEALRDANIVKILQKYCKLGIINMIIGEEIHKMKNPTCSQSKGFLKLNADCQISVSGTPLVNNPVDLFVLFKWHGIETHTYTAFKNRYCVFGGFAGREIIGYQHLKELKDTLNKIQLRRYKKDVLDLPNKLPQTVYVEMGKQQEKIYNEVLLDLQKNIDLIMLNPNPLSQLTRLRQATACPSLLSSTISESVKLDKLEELVAEIAKNGEQCLVFSNWAQVCEIAAERLKKYNAKTYTGLTKNLKAVETEFKENKKITALIGTIKQMGTGLTFTNCNYVIFLDSPWTQADKDQCIDRTHRIGQTKDVTIITLVCANTIDEKVEKIVKTKGLLSNAIVDNVKAMNNRDLLDFLLF